MENNYKFIDKCRFCGSDNLEQYLDLGFMPLANNLLDSPNQLHDKYPLQVNVCNNCSMSQLNVVVDPNVLFTKYLYRSGMSKTFIRHCKDLADEIQEFSPTSGLVVDIASNDGTFLSQFEPIANNPKYVKTLGVEPAKNLCEISRNNGIKTINDFFNYQTALNISAEYGQANVITAQNVFAHVDDICEFMQGIHRLLKDTGVLILEAPWVGSLIEQTDLGNVYHEHVSYLSVTGMKDFMNKFGLHLNRIKYFPNIHTGTIRYYINKQYDISNQWEIENVIYREEMTRHLYSTLQSSVDSLKYELLELIGNDAVVGVGAAAKSTTICNYFGLKDKVSVIYDNTPEKHYKYQPGTLIPILPFDMIGNAKEKIIIFPHNLKREIIKNVRKLNYQAKFINIIPNISEE